MPRSGIAGSYDSSWGFPDGASGKVPACQCRRHKRYMFNPWVGMIPWRRACQPTPVFLPGKSHGQWSLVSYGPQDLKELNMTEVTSHTHTYYMVVLFLVFEGTSILFFIVAAPIYILSNSVGGFLFLHTLSSIYYL